MKIGVNAFIIARETEAEAQAVLKEIIAKAEPEAVNGFGSEVKNAGASSPEGEGNWAKSTSRHEHEVHGPLREWTSEAGSSNQYLMNFMSISNTVHDLT